MQLRKTDVPQGIQEGPSRGKIVVLIAVLILVVVASIAIVADYVFSQVGCFGCGVHYSCVQPGNGFNIKCPGLDVTFSGPSCNLRTGICRVTLTNNGTTPSYDVYSHDCFVLWS